MLLGERHQREAIAGFEQWIADHFFGGSTVTLLPKHAEDVLHLRIGDKEHRISEFGTGIQNLILILVTLCDWDDGPLLLLIDEPELSMHEGLQRLLVKGLVQDIPKLREHDCQVICTTHSATFLDRTIQSNALTLIHASENGPSDFTLAKQGDGTSSPTFTLVRRAQPPFTILRSLGATNSSLLLTNCGIWVEGPTDGMYLRAFMKLYALKHGKNEPVQNLHYTMAHYGGSLVKYLTEEDDESFLDIRHFGGNPLIISDRDDVGSKRDRKQRLRDLFGDQYVELRCREIENLLPYSTIRSVIKSYDPDLPVPSTCNRKLFRNRRLGEFIDSELLGDPKKSKRYRSRSAHGAYATDEGALKDKPEFARRACDTLTSFRELPTEAQSLAKLVYEHIALFS